MGVPGITADFLNRCSVTVVPVFPCFSLLPHPLSLSQSHPIVHYHGSFLHVPWLDPSPSFPHFPSPLSPLVSVILSVSLLPCLWFYFVYLFFRKGKFLSSCFIFSIWRDLQRGDNPSLLFPDLPDWSVIIINNEFGGADLYSGNL